MPVMRNVIKIRALARLVAGPRRRSGVGMRRGYLRRAAIATTTGSIRRRMSRSCARSRRPSSLAGRRRPSRDAGRAGGEWGQKKGKRVGAGSP